MIQLLLVLVLFTILIILLSFIFIALFISLKSAPFVPTSDRVLDEIFKNRIKKGQTMVDLGSGDGRVVRYVSKKFQVKSVGIELNPILVLYSNLISKVLHLPATFRMGDLYKVDLKGYDVIFLFLLPGMLEKLKPNLEKSKGLIIAHGFKIKGFDKYLVDQINRKRFSTYFYKVTSD